MLAPELADSGPTVSSPAGSLVKQRLSGSFTLPNSRMPSSSLDHNSGTPARRASEEMLQVDRRIQISEMPGHVVAAPFPPGRITGIIGNRASPSVDLPNGTQAALIVVTRRNYQMSAFSLPGRTGYPTCKEVLRLSCLAGRNGWSNVSCVSGRILSKGWNTCLWRAGGRFGTAPW